MRSTIIEHELPSGKKLRWCMRCRLHVDLENKIDLDFYTARQYLKIMAIPEEERCTHQRNDVYNKIRGQVDCRNSDLLVRIGETNIAPDLRSLLAAIVQRIS